MGKQVHLVWLKYPNEEEQRLSAIFTSRAEAEKYANRDDGQGKKSYTCVVTSEPIYQTAEEV